jgi:hypothetical protein
VITGLVVAALAIPSVALFHIAHGKSDHHGKQEQRGT